MNNIISNVSTLIVDDGLNLKRIKLIIIRFRIKDRIYRFELHENYTISIGSIFGWLICILIIVLRSVFKKIKKIIEKRLKTRSRRLKRIRRVDKQLSIV